MAKKNGPTGADDQAPVEHNPEGPEARHKARQVERRALESELAEIENRIRAAINDGDTSLLTSLNKRKVELPELFINASMAETEARREIANAEDAANSKALNAAQAAQEKIAAQLAKCKADFEKESASLTEALQEAEGNIRTLYSLIAAARNLGADHDAAFRKSLAKLAGV